MCRNDLEVTGKFMFFQLIYFAVEVKQMVPKKGVKK